MAQTICTQCTHCHKEYMATHGMIPSYEYRCDATVTINFITGRMDKGWIDCTARNTNGACSYYEEKRKPYHGR